MFPTRIPADTTTGWIFDYSVRYKLAASFTDEYVPRSNGFHDNEADFLLFLQQSTSEYLSLRRQS